MEVIKFISLLTSVWLFVEGASVIQFIKNFLNVGNFSKPTKLWVTLIQKLINCAMCSGFWFGFVYYQNFLLACLTSISAEVFKLLINSILSKFQKL